MRFLIISLLLVSLSFTTACNKGHGGKHSSQPIQTPSPTPTLSPTPPQNPEPHHPNRPPGHPAGFETILALQGFVNGDTPFFLFIERNENDEYHAYADVAGCAYDLKNWTLSVLVIKDNSSLTVSEADPSSLPCPEDFIPTCFEGDLIGRCDNSVQHVSLQFVPKANDTVAIGQLISNESTADIAAHMVLCLDNGYIPAWERPCP